MPTQITGRPSDGRRKLNLRYRVDDPRYGAIERLRETLGHGQNTGVLLAALALGAELMAARMSLPRQSSPKSGMDSVRSDSPRVPSVQVAGPADGVVPGEPGQAQHIPLAADVPADASDGARPIAVAQGAQFSEGTAKQFAQFGGMD